jgi:hypothetical protein
MSPFFLLQSFFLFSYVPLSSFTYFLFPVPQSVDSSILIRYNLFVLSLVAGNFYEKVGEEVERAD